MKNPNGYGSISNMGGNRRKPWRARITKGWEFDKKNKKKRQIFVTIGYFATRKDAMLALSKYHADPYDIEKGTITFSEAYERWSAQAYPKMGKSNLYQFKLAYKKCAPLHNKQIKDIKTDDMQKIMNSLKQFGSTTQHRQKGLFKRVFNYCIANDLADKNYAEYLETDIEEKNKNIHSHYTENEIRLLWDNLELPVPLQYSRKDIRNIFPVDTILMMIYTGMRPSELLTLKNEQIKLEERYIVGGMKTTAGKNRIIPIHKDIHHLFKNRYNPDNNYFIGYKSDNPPTLTQYRTYIYDPVITKLELNHLPHDGRHTFATCANRSGINEVISAKVIGHKTGEITKDVYTHKEIQELIDEVDKIIFIKK